MSDNVTSAAKPVKTTGLHVGDAGPGCKKADPILIADGVRRTFGGVRRNWVIRSRLPESALNVERGRG